ncbi:hypothetical protein HUU40_05070 [candidate division KSB1 bacterium]|nr:hypothetical protein [candidate division KSB1 bacterium]
MRPRAAGEPGAPLRATAKLLLRARNFVRQLLAAYVWNSNLSATFLYRNHQNKRGKIHPSVCVKACLVAGHMQPDRRAPGNGIRLVILPCHHQFMNQEDVLLEYVKTRKEFVL